eukprot:GILI01014239.1.p1 GENE.GILI01014239.1~~GILI01014239.1.p1  ORF type:complete len:127 (-),score=25.93 GILI01014239.1:200-580(-)
MSQHIVLMATSLDERHPPQNILENNNTFWTSTGLYPQEILIQLGAPTVINHVKLTCTNIRRFSLQGCEATSPVNFEKILETEFTDKKQRLQSEVMQVTNNKAFRFVKVTILSGWNDFCSIHRVAFD